MRLEIEEKLGSVFNKSEWFSVSLIPVAASQLNISPVNVRLRESPGICRTPFSGN